MVNTFEVSIGDIPESRVISTNNTSFPLVITPSSYSPSALPVSTHMESSNDDTLPSQLSHYLTTHREYLIKSLIKHGAILFRGFPIESPFLFLDFIECFDFVNFPYVGGNAVRRKIVGDRIFTTNESPPDKKIPFHHELAQTQNAPSKLLFYCVTPAASGGQTPIVHSVELYERLIELFPDFVHKLEQFGVVYSRVMKEEDRAESAIGRGWKATFNVNNRDELEMLLNEKGEKCEWFENGDVRHSSKVLPAILSLEDGRKSFFNQIVAAYLGWSDELNRGEDCVRFGNGDQMEMEVIKTIERLMNELCVAFEWNSGDVLLLDNQSVMHARAEFTGKRIILASLISN